MCKKIALKALVILVAVSVCSAHLGTVAAKTSTNNPIRVARADTNPVQQIDVWARISKLPKDSVKTILIDKSQYEDIILDPKDIVIKSLREKFSSGRPIVDLQRTEQNVCRSRKTDKKRIGCIATVRLNLQHKTIINISNVMIKASETAVWANHIAPFLKMLIRSNKFTLKAFLFLMEKLLYGLSLVGIVVVSIGDPLSFLDNLKKLTFPAWLIETIKAVIWWFVFDFIIQRIKDFGNHWGKIPSLPVKRAIIFECTNCGL